MQQWMRWWPVWLILAGGAAWAEPAQLVLTLDDAVTQALAQSPPWQAKQQELEAMRARESLQAGWLWPRLSVEGSFRYLSTVPTLTLDLPVPGAPSQEFTFGAHDNYSIGPMLSWTLWDSGGLYYAWLGARAALEAKELEVDALRRQLRQQVRGAYIQTQLALEKISLMIDALNLSLAQYRDIQTQVQAGASSRRDLLSSHQEVLSHRRQLLEARGEAGSALRQLMGQLGEPGKREWAMPLSPAQAKNLPAAAEPATLLLVLDSLEDALHAMRGFAQAPLDPEHPQRQSLARLTESARQGAAAASAGFWPKVSVALKSSLDYPNGPVLETINQNTVSAGLSWTLFQGGAVRQQVEQQQRTARVYAEQEKQAWLDLNIAWNRAQDAVARLEAEAGIDQTSVTETEELAKLAYQAYRIGRASYLDVQTANYRALGARIQAAQTKAAMLLHLTVLESLAAPKETQP